MITGGHWEWSVCFAKSRDSTVFLQFRSSKLTLNAAWELAAADAFMASWTCKTCKIYHLCALQDLLNNLESCDLDDDDLMLDVDVSEEASLHSGMNPSVWVHSAASVVEAATVPSKFLQMETPSPTWLSGEGDNSAGGCRKFMITGGVGFTPVFIKFPPRILVFTKSPLWFSQRPPGLQTGQCWEKDDGRAQGREPHLGPLPVEVILNIERLNSVHRLSPATCRHHRLCIKMDGDFTRWFVNACSED